MFAKYCVRVRYSLRNFKDKDQAKKLCASALFCSLIILGAYIKIPLAVPITLQLLFTNTAAITLKKKWGYIPSLLYLLLGLAGLPVFSVGGGIASIISPTFGFNIGFVIGAAVAGRVADKGTDRSLVLASVLDLLCVYLCGAVYYYFIETLYFGESLGTYYVISVCVLPFLIPDAVKIALSITLAKKLKKLSRIP